MLQLRSGDYFHSKHISQKVTWHLTARMPENCGGTYEYSLNNKCMGVSNRGLGVFISQRGKIYDARKRIIDKEVVSQQNGGQQNVGEILPRVGKA